MAVALAVLQSQTALGPIEVLFTVHEEDTMSGAMGLKAGVLQGKILINLDSTPVGEFTIGSAGGEDVIIQATYPETAAPEGMAAYKLSVAGLKGGHSGVDINLGRGHAAKLLVRLLKELSTQYGVRLAQFTSGSADNAIPRDAYAVVVLPRAEADAFLQAVRAYQDTVKSELAAVDPDVTVQAAPTDPPARVMDEQTQRTLIDALYATPQGVIRMSSAVPDMVETSTNMGIVEVGGGDLEINCLLRSSVDSELDDLAETIAGVWKQAGMPVRIDGRYSGWNPNPASPILALMKTTYQDMFAQQPKILAIHAGLECGTIRSIYPQMDAISIGPTVLDEHSPDEKMEIASVKTFSNFLLETLRRIPEQVR